MINSAQNNPYAGGQGLAQQQMIAAGQGLNSTVSLGSYHAPSPLLVIDEVANGYLVKGHGKTYIAADVEELKEMVVLALVNAKMDAAK